MNYLMREQDEADEERFRKLDAAIRGNLKKKETKKDGAETKRKGIKNAIALECDSGAIAFCIILRTRMQ